MCAISFSRILFMPTFNITVHKNLIWMQLEKPSNNKETNIFIFLLFFYKFQLEKVEMSSFNWDNKVAKTTYFVSHECCLYDNLYKPAEMLKLFNTTATTIINQCLLRFNFSLNLNYCLLFRNKLLTGLICTHNFQSLLNRSVLLLVCVLAGCLVGWLAAWLNWCLWLLCMNNNEVSR